MNCLVGGSEVQEELGIQNAGGDCGVGGVGVERGKCVV